MPIGATAPPPRYVPMIEDVMECDESDSARLAYGSVSEAVRRSSEMSQFFTLRDPFNRLALNLKEAGLLANGWDSYGAAAPNREAISSAQEFLRKLRAHSFAPNAVVPSAEGGIATYFFQGQRTAYVEHLNSGETVLALYGPGMEPEIVELSEAQSESAIKEIQRYLAG